MRGILFDVGNTLLHVDPEGVTEALRSVGLDVDREAFRAAEGRARARLVRVMGEEGKGTEEHIWRAYFVTLLQGLGVPDDRMEEGGEAVRELHRRSHLWSHVQAGTPEALASLLDRGYRLGAVSNADGNVEELLRRSGLREYLGVVVDSEVVGIEKPDPEIFLLGARGLGLEPAECLFVGDLYPVDVVGARGAGMDAVLVDPVGEESYPVDTLPSVTALPGYLQRKEI